MPEDIFQYVLLAALAVGIFFLFRSSRKNKTRQEELKAQIVPGVEVMTNFGLFGMLLSVDEISNVAEIETSPGVIVRIHRQTIAKVVEQTEETGEPRSVEEAMERANREYEAKNSDSAVSADSSALSASARTGAVVADPESMDEPEFGERVSELDTAGEIDTAGEPDNSGEPEKKAPRRTSKKSGE